MLPSQITHLLFSNPKSQTKITILAAMKKGMIWSIGFVVILLYCLPTYGQRLPDLTNTKFPTSSGTSSSGSLLEKDTVEAYKRYPLVRFSTDKFDYSLQQIDTSITWFQNYIPAQQGEFENLFIGNLGQPNKPLVFDYQKAIGFQNGFRQYDKNWFTHESVPYFFSPYPFADLEYIFGPDEEQVINLTFTQRIKQQTNYTLRYRRQTSPGSYTRQRAGISNFAGSLWYQHPKQRYNLLTHFRANGAKLELNGGLATPIQFFENPPAQNSFAEILLSNADSERKERSFFMQHSFDWGKHYEEKTIRNRDTLVTKKFVPAQRIGYTINHTTNNYLYFDGSAKSTYYHNFYINRAETDTIVPDPALYYHPLKWRSIQNEGFLTLYGKKRKAKNDTLSSNLAERTFTARAGFMLDFIKIRQQPIGLEMLPLRVDTFEYDTVIARIDTSFNLNTGILNFYLENNPQSNKFLFYRLKGEYALFGYNLADFKIDGLLRLQLNEKVGGIRGKILLSRLEPDYLEQRWYGAHFEWNNDFKKITSLRLSGTYFNSFWDLEATYVNHTLQNYIVWNEEAQPKQLEEVVNISQFIVKKDLHLGKFHLLNTLVYQVSTSDSIRFPSFWGKQSWYYENRLFKNTLLTKIGFDVHYNTNYFADDFAPFSGQFFIQNAEKARFYPVIDLFLVMKIKRVRLFLKMAHINQGLFKQKGYFTAYRYPAPDRNFRFGVSWMFFD